jgi:superkiller protein 3
MLGYALTHHLPPKYHARADKIFTGLLSDGVVDPVIWLSRGFIDQCSGKWLKAYENFDNIIKNGVTRNALVDLEAREGKAWALVNQLKLEEGLLNLSLVLDALDEKDDQERKLKGRVQWKIGQTLQFQGQHLFYFSHCPLKCIPPGVDQEEVYKCFIDSLRHDPSFAPAFTSLGVYYFSKDEKRRANRCFQKAFELDVREVKAAKMLAESFASEEEWELVAVIANRLLDSEENKIGQGISLAEDLWAWKALGIVHLVILFVARSSGFN